MQSMTRGGDLRWCSECVSGITRKRIRITVSGDLPAEGDVS